MNVHNQRKGCNSLKNILKFVGPAFIVSVAYIDPGNFATNISGGSIFNYNLLWVILLSNVMAIFLQINSAKLGIATGKNLSEVCRETFSKRTNIIMWIFAELAAMATTLAEFLGGALGLYLLFRIPMPIAGLLTALITFLITYMQKYGQKTIEIVVTFFVAIICIAYGIEMFLAKPDWLAVGLHVITPSIPNSDALLIAVGMLGATVMPHVIFLHSQLVQARNHDKDINMKKRHLKMEKIDVVIAMNIAFIVNAAMVIASAAVFYRQGLAVESIEVAHQSLAPLLGTLSSAAFGIALLASGLSSSVVGTMAGESVLDGFINIKISNNMKRIVTMLPALLIIFIGINPMKVLVLSQVSLSFILPMAVIPLLIITSRKEIMGVFVNSRITKCIGVVVAGIILILNIVLICTTLLNNM